MYYLNKLVWFFLNPAALVVAGLLAALVLALLRRRRTAILFTALTLGFFLFAASGYGVLLLGLPLERPYLATQSVESLPAADAIVLLGGGVGTAKALAYPELADAGDRVLHAARLQRAGKAPIVVVSGANDLETTVPLLLECGVPREAIVVDNESRNTYENSRFTERLLKPGARILLVTSAWHMTRARGNFAQTSLEAVPAACDFKVTFLREHVRNLWDGLVPSAENFFTFGYVAKEWLGRLARK